ASTVKATYSFTSRWPGHIGLRNRTRSRRAGGPGVLARVGTGRWMESRAGGSSTSRRQAGGGPLGCQSGAGAIFRATNSTIENVCRPSSDRDRERALVRGRAGAHARTFRIAGATDCDFGSAEGYLNLARRIAAGI